MAVVLVDGEMLDQDKMVVQVVVVQHGSLQELIQVVQLVLLLLLE
jgi:hypothetical protein